MDNRLQQYIMVRIRREAPFSTLWDGLQQYMLQHIRAYIDRIILLLQGREAPMAASPPPACNICNNIFCTLTRARGILAFLRRGVDMLARVGYDGSAR